MTPQFVGLRVEVRERRALSQYRTARSIYRARLWMDAERRAGALREALVARAEWSLLHDLQRDEVAA